MRLIKKLVLGLLLLIILLVIFHKAIYRYFIKPNKNIWPYFIQQYIEKRDSRRPENEPIVYKEERIVKIIEGWALEDINQFLSSEGIWEQDEFYKFSGKPKNNYQIEDQSTWPKDYSEQFSFLDDKPKYHGLEGFLFPDTYRIFFDAEPEDLLIKMLENFDKKLSPQMRADIKRQGRSVYEVITLASIIEKEAPINYQDPQNIAAKTVAGIFLNRLQIGQALQSDATLSYLFQDNKPIHSGDELKVDSPYNTYLYPGLPPTPISNPGIKAIEAAIYPVDTDYYFFLTTLDGKEIYYAQTYSEHLQNKNKYLP